MLRAALATRCDTLESTLRVEVDYQSLLFQTGDHKDAVKAFLEKREPDFAANKDGSEFGYQAY